MDDGDTGQERWVARTASGFLTVEHGAYMALGLLLSVAALVALAGAAWVLFDVLSDWT